MYIGGKTMAEIAARWFDPSRPIPEEEQLDRFRQSLPYLVARAIEAREQAVSWRNFQVGCTFYAFRTAAYSAVERWKIFAGSNIKVNPESRPVCAEQIALGAARAARYDRIIGMVICGTPQQEEGCAENYPTLHPCKECRAVFKVSPEISMDTIIVTVTPNGETHEVRTFGEFLQIHGEANNSGMAQ